MFYGIQMDWNFAIERNRGDLLPVVLGLFTLIGLAEGGMVERLSRPLYRKALGLLRSAESAVRRLIVVMARDIVVEPRPKRPRPSRPVIAGKGKAKPMALANPAPRPFNCATRKSAPMPARSAAGGGTKAPSPAFVSWITIPESRSSCGASQRPQLRRLRL
jgi:hypothetical protein